MVIKMMGICCAIAFVIVLIGMGLRWLFQVGQALEESEKGKYW